MRHYIYFWNEKWFNARSRNCRKIWVDLGCIITFDGWSNILNKLSIIILNVFLEEEIWKKVVNTIGKEKYMKYMIYNWWSGAIKCGRFGDGQCWCLQMS